MRTWIRLHRHALGAAISRFAAAPFAHATSVLVLGVAIALPVAAVMLLRTAAGAAAQFDTDPHINVFMALDATDEDVRSVEAALRSHPESAAVRFVPRAEALAELKATTHLAEILASLDRNPLPHAFTVKIRSTDEARVGSARAAWAALPRVDQVTADFEWSQRLGKWVGFARKLVAGVVGLLALAVVFIVGHLIRLQVLTRRDEIVLSQLIGATAADVRRPFLYHGMVQGLLAGGAALALAAAGAWALGTELRALTPQYMSELKLLFLPFGDQFTVLATAAALGWLGAWLAVQRELKPFAAPR